MCGAIFGSAVNTSILGMLVRRELPKRYPCCMLDRYLPKPDRNPMECQYAGVLMRIQRFIKQFFHLSAN